ncbi:MAG: N-acetylmuramoyl-L-alanine amidase [Armatimonadota bacterium]|nr:N-acetylmuramoyl-L-alanine amidase [Armatimonadota bacterium]
MSAAPPPFDPNRTLHGYTFDPNRTLHGYKFDPNRTLHGFAYDRYTFDRWEKKRAEQARQVRQRNLIAALALVVVFLVVCVGSAWRLRHRLATLIAPPPPAAQARPLAGTLVILDPGHGGEDPGASLNFGPVTVNEAALTYRTSRELAAALRVQGADVRYTVRSAALDARLSPDNAPPPMPTDAVLVATDKPLTARIRRSPRQLWQRAEFAHVQWDRRAASRFPDRGVYFISVHYDDSRTDTVHGALVWVDKRAPVIPPLALNLAQALQAQDWSRPESFRGHKGIAGDTLGVLNPRFNPIPERVLLEVATLSNADDLSRAEDPAWRRSMVQAITQAVVETHRQVR